MRQLRLKHGLDALVLRFHLSMHLLSLGINLLLQGGNLLNLLTRKLIELMLHETLLMAELFHLTFQHLEPIRDIILNHVGVQ